MRMRQMSGPLMAVLSSFAIPAFAVIPAHAGAPPERPLDTARIEKLTGAKGSLDEVEGVFKVSVPRADLNVTVGGVRLTPRMGLTSWAAFQRAGKDTIVMGDLCLLEDQVNPVMSAALDAGLEVTALHNHFLLDTPRVMFMHVGGMGEEGALAAAVGTVFARMKVTSEGKPEGDVPRAPIDPGASTLDPGTIESILGIPGEYKDGVYKIIVGRKARMHGAEIGGTMGVSTWAAFTGSDAHAAVDGDVAVRESELQGVLKALRKSHFDIVAIHQHMAGEDPRLVFLHYWGLGSTKGLAWGLRAALDLTGVPPAAAAGE